MNSTDALIAAADRAIAESQATRDKVSMELAACAVASRERLELTYAAIGASLVARPNSMPQSITRT
jgi:hypothetical protein